MADRQSIFNVQRPKIKCSQFCQNTDYFFRQGWRRQVLKHLQVVLPLWVKKRMNCPLNILYDFSLLWISTLCRMELFVLKWLEEISQPFILIVFCAVEVYMCTFIFRRPHLGDSEAATMRAFITGSYRIDSVPFNPFTNQFLAFEKLKLLA